MSKLRELTNTTLKAKSAGHSGLFTTKDLALLTDNNSDINFTKLLHKAVKAGVLEKVCKNVFINPLSPIDVKGVLAKIANILHWDKFIYISLESQLSYLGVISQVTMNRLTVMTTGRAALIKTKYGIIEFTHTSRKVASIGDEVYFDPDIGIFRATKEKAIKDLKRVGRNIEMIRAS
jgi:hypothetical protein